jgi:hypothetical protein
MNETNLTVVVSPVQLAAILSGQPIYEHEMRSNRLWAGLKVLGGSLEMVAAAALLLAPEPTMLTKAGGVTLGAHGSDTLSTGFWQLWTGREQRTLTDQAATALALHLGAEPGTASKIGTAVDIAVPVLVSIGLGAARIAAIRAGRVSLIEHEAQAGSRIGGHTLLKHIGKTEAELRARLLSQPGIPVASTFKSLEIAERIIYDAVRANRSGIESWARTAAPGARQAFFHTASTPVGHGVVRASNSLVQMSKVRIVMKLEQYRGKLYYILTAFPEL